MAQSPRRVTLARGSTGVPLESSFAATIRWQVANAALAQETAPNRLDVVDQTAAVLAAWRSAERSLSDHLEAGPDRDRLRGQVMYLRAKYQRLIEAEADSDHAAALSGTD
jgi:hypothetical protein